MIAIEELLRRAVNLHQAGQLGDAEKLYRDVLAASPDNADALNLLGVILKQRGAPLDALPLIEKAVALAPEHRSARFNLVRLFEQLERYADAATHCRELVRLDPQDADLHFQNANFLQRLGQNDEAIVAYARAAELAPDKPQASHNLGLLHYQAGRFEEAIVAFRQSLAARSDLPVVHRAIGLAYLALARGNEAVHHLREAARLLPGRVDVQLELARAELQASNVTEAEAGLLQVLRMDPANRAAFELLGEIRSECERVRRAMSSMVGLRQGTHRPNIYIKCYSRPLYVDRCIRSIRMHVRNHGDIILLNDGMGEQYVERLQRDHPDLILRQSPKLRAGIVATPANQAFQERRSKFRELDYLDPVHFWCAEIGSDAGPYCLIIEEDCWFTEIIDVAALAEEMAKNRILAASMMYENVNYAASRRTLQEILNFWITEEGRRIEVFKPRLSPKWSRSWTEGYRVFPIANCLISTDFWTNSYEGNLHWTNEHHALIKALRFWEIGLDRGIEFRFANVAGGVIRHCTTSTSRTDAGGSGITSTVDTQVLNDAMNELWISGQLSSLTGFPNDIGVDTLVEALRLSVPASQIDAWEHWRSEYLRKFPFLLVDAQRL